jgi:hypothetical protein
MHHFKVKLHIGYAVADKDNLTVRFKNNLVHYQSSKIPSCMAIIWSTLL